jgi:hypothetical protein
VKATSLTPVFTEYIPSKPDEGTLYISMKFVTAVHLCACGCKAKVVTPFGPDDWILTFDGTVTLRPSVGNGQQPCRSHYYIRCNNIDWLPKMSPAATVAASARDRAAHMAAADRPRAVVPASWSRRLWRRLTRSAAD